MRGKIIRGIAGFYYVETEEAVVLTCKAKGVFRGLGIKPLVGDDVEVEPLEGEPGTANLVRVLPRKNELLRPAVANVDQTLLVFAAASPEPNRNLLDRFLLRQEWKKLPVLLCFNKSDLVTEEKRRALENGYRGTGYEVCFLSAKERRGVDELLRLLAGKTTVLAGPSGVGKSTLVNVLVPEAGMATGELSERIQRGKHTTRHSELLYAGEETYLCDTPGFTSLDLPQILPEELKSLYPEFAPYQEDCRFRGCLHENEPDCAVKAAVGRGEISQTRYAGYLEFYRELKRQKRYR